MTIMFAVLGAATLLELLLSMSSWLWRGRKYLVPVVVVGISFSTGGLSIGLPGVASALVGLVSTYRVFNLLRVAEARMHEKYLRRVVRQTSFWLVGLQLVVGCGWLLVHNSRLSAYTWWNILAVAQLAIALGLAASVARNLKKTRPITTRASYTDRELPSISVAIPARNEDEQLEDCLRSVLASDYPKLEVLVLDDCSQDRTPQIIRGFAHDGVRFIPGEEPRANWLAKNQAYERLAQEASGGIILFCGVDVRFAPHTIRQLITLLKAKHKDVLSVLPVNEQAGLSFVQSMRYYWELALPRRWFNRPPVLSTCWLITADELKKCGGFAAVARSITPEAHFARESIKHDGYSFLRSDTHFGVTSDKSMSEQRDTAVRTRYPQLHRRPELVFLVSLAELTLLLLPFLFFVGGFWFVFGAFGRVVLFLSCFVLLVIYKNIVLPTFPKSTAATLAFPLAVALDTYMLHFSMWKYEFSSVEWKDRNICIPIMHVEPHLPKLP